MGLKMNAKQQQSFNSKFGSAFLHATRNAGPLAKRLKVFAAAVSVYEKGDTEKQLQDKIVAQLGVQAGVGAFDWLALIQAILPIVMQLLAMFLK